ncbi:MAG: SCP2 sterol-binding domain-containing protein [Dehalococcoidia bacterium]|jgi:putative sterol carrier protein|nr:SCP2 sterol-binding domain-containing protein [Dehalococcoidia bacterium]
MTEVKVKTGEELNGLGAMLKDIMDTNLRDPEKYKSVERVKGSVVIKESSSGVAVTLHLDQGKLELQNDAIAKPTAYMEAGFENLAHISSGQLNPIVAILTGKVKSGGNPFLLLKVSKIMVLK